LVVQTTDRVEGGVIEARHLQRSFGDGLILLPDALPSIAK
jgi:hypothetical protein